MSNENNTILDFKGPAGRTYFDRDGVLQTADEDEIREEYDPLTGSYLGMLIESSFVTRLNHYATDFTGTGVGGATTAPTGNSLKGLKQWKITPSSEEGSNFINLGSYPADGNDRVFSVVVSSSEYSHIRMNNRFTYLNTSGSNFDLNRGEILQNNNDAKIKSLGDGMFRCSITIPSQGGTTNRAYVSALPGPELQSYSNFSGDGSSGVYIYHAQVELGTQPTSIIMGENGGPFTRVGENARFTDPAVFNNFERGSFYIDFKTKNDSVGILSGAPDDGQSRLLNVGNGGLFTRPVGGYWEFSKPKSQYAVALSLGQNITPTVDGENFGPFDYKGIRVSDQLLLCGDTSFPGSVHIKNLDFNPTTYTDAEARQLTKRDAATVIGDAPSGGYYDYSDLSTMLVESDESGIPVEDRKIARVGDPIGAILDKSGHGNHLTASTDSRRGILRSNGDNYYIERGANTIYGFDFSSDYSLTVMIALQNYSDRFIVLCDQDGGNGNYAMIYDASTTNAHLSWSAFGSPRYYVNGGFTPASNRGDTGATLQTNPTQLRTLHRVTDGYTARIFVGGYTSGGWSLTGAEYGFAWASRLSEDDALIVEEDTQKNMPPVT